ncbi:MAG: KH domain-containing protein [Dehalococcoidia bacterium]
MKEFVEYVGRGLVDHPDAVSVEEERWRDRVVLRLSVDDSDMGKVIGKGGRIAHAMRSLLNASATRDGVRVSLDIGEPAPRRSGGRRSGWR